MRNPTLSLAAIAFALSACTQATTTGATPTTGTTPAVAPVLQLAAGTAFTVAQGAAQAYIAKHPTSAAGIQAGLTAAQAAFLAWVNAPAGTPAQQTAEAALTAANTSLLQSLASQGVKF